MKAEGIPKCFRNLRTIDSPDKQACIAATALKFSIFTNGGVISMIQRSNISYNSFNDNYF